MSSHVPADNVAATAWLQEALEPWPEADGGVRIHSLVPATYSRFAVIPTGEGIELPQDRAKRLGHLLEGFTETPAACWFGIWDGYGTLGRPSPAAPVFELPGRRYYLYRGSCSAAGDFLWGDGWFQPPDLWWPDDRAWMVGGDVDLDVYVAGDAELIDAVLADGSFAARPARPDQRVDAGA